MGFQRRELALVGTAAALVFSRVFGISVVLPGFVGHAEGLSGATDVLVGTAFGAYGLTLALMQLPMGWLSDHWGRKPVLLLGSVLFVAGTAWAAMADSVPSLLAARLMQGTGAIGSAAMAMVGESVPAQRRTMAMALVGIPAGLGFFVGLIVAAGLEPVIGVRSLFWLSGAIALAAMLPVPFLRPGVSHEAAPMARMGRDVLTLAAAGFVMNYALTTVLYYLSASDRAGPGLLVPLAVALVVMGGASRAVDKRGWTWQPITVLLALVGAFGLASVAAEPWQIWAAGFFAVHATMSAVLPSQVSRISGRSGGRGHGIQNVIAYVGTFLAGPVAGIFADQAAVAGSILFGIALMVGLVAAMRWWHSRSTHPTPLGSEAE